MKTITKFIALTALVSSTLMADFARVEMGAGAWMSTPTGGVSYTDSGADGSDLSQEKETTSPYVWMYIKHPIPVIPNLRLEYVSVESEGDATGEFENFEVPVNSNTKLEMTQYDIIPYYNILDNTFWITLDLGLDIKMIDLAYQAEDVSIDSGAPTTYSESEMIALPLLYARTRVEIPGTNIGLEADAKYLKYDDTTVYDARIKVDYTLDFMPIIQPAIEVGYRVQKYDVNDNDFGGIMDLEFSGVYAGAIVRF